MIFRVNIVHFLICLHHIVFTLSIGTSQLLTVLVLKFEQVHLGEQDMNWVVRAGNSKMFTETKGYNFLKRSSDWTLTDETVSVYATFTEKYVLC